MYYDSAALAGGWDVSGIPTSFGEADAPKWLTLGENALRSYPKIDREMQDHLRKQFPTLVDKDYGRLRALAFAYDTALATGNTELRNDVNDVLAWADDAKASRKAFNYIRRRVHRGTTRKTRRTRAQRISSLMQSISNRNAKRAFLTSPGTSWVGSDPIIGRSRSGAYSGLSALTRPLNAPIPSTASRARQAYLREYNDALRNLPQPTWNPPPLFGPVPKRPRPSGLSGPKRRRRKILFLEYPASPIGPRIEEVP